MCHYQVECSSFRSVKKHCFQRKLHSSEQFPHHLVLTKSVCVTFKFTVSSLCFMYSAGVWCTYLHVARIIADYLLRYSEVEAFRYINRLLLKVFLLLVFRKMCFLPAIIPFPLKNDRILFSFKLF